MDIRILDLATRITERAMGAPASAANWIGNEEAVVKFLQTTAHMLHDLSTNQDEAVKD
jgi:hypothetical protein